MKRRGYPRPYPRGLIDGLYLGICQICGLDAGGSPREGGLALDTVGRYDQWIKRLLRALELDAKLFTCYDGDRLGAITNIGDTQGLRSLGQTKGELPLRVGEGPTAGVLNADDRSTFDRFIVLSRNDYPSHGYLLLCQVSPTERTRSNRLSKLFLISELVNLEVNIYNEEALLEEIQEKRFLQTLCMGMLYTNRYTPSYFAYGYASSC